LTGSFSFLIHLFRLKKNKITPFQFILILFVLYNWLFSSPNLLLMKIFLLAIFCQLSFISPAQVRSAMPPEAATFYTNAMCCIKPEIRNQIEKNASDLKSNNADSLKKALKQNDAFIGLNSPEINGIAVLIMVQASKNADANLKEFVLNKGKNQVESATDQTKLLLDYKSDMAKSISFLMKNLLPSSQSVINNLK